MPTGGILHRRCHMRGLNLKLKLVASLHLPRSTLLGPMVSMPTSAVDRALLMGPPPASCSDGGGVVQQKLFHNFRHFRIYDLSNHSINNQHLLVS